MVAIAKKLADSKGGLPFVGFVAILMGGAVAFVSVAMPTPLFERLVVMSRLPLILPPAEPPLGFTARTLLAVVTGLCAFAATLIGLRLIGGHPRPRRKLDPEEGQAEFLFVESEPMVREEKLRLRRADSHPDAPPRRPIFAQEDLGESFDTFGDSLNELRLDPYEIPADPQPRTIPFAEPEPPMSHADAACGAPADAGAPSGRDPAVEAAEPAAASSSPVSQEGSPPSWKPEVERPAALSGNESIEDLVARLEAGLARQGRRTSAGRRPAPLRPIAAAGDAEDALREALDEIRRTTFRG